MKNLEKLVNGKTQVFTEKNGSIIYLNGAYVITNYPVKNINGKLVKCSPGEETINFNEQSEIDNAKVVTSEILTELEKIKIASKFCGNDEMRPVMSSVFIDNGDIVATDAHILVKYSNCASFMNFEKVLIHSKIVSLLEGAKMIKLSEKFIYIEHEDFRVLSRFEDAKYPNYNAVIVRNELIQKAVNIQINEDFKQALILSNNVTNCISIYDNKVKYYFEEEKQINEFEIKQVDPNLNKDLTIMLMPIMGDTKMPNCQDISLNCKMLKKVVDAYKVDNVTINIAHANKPMLITFEQKQKSKPINKKTMEKQETKSVDTDILSALMQQISAFTQQVAELKNQQISTPKIETEPIKESAKIEEQKPIETVKPVIHVQKYSDKSLIVYGDTKQIKDQLMQLHARFNPYLKLNDVKTPGWIVSVKQEEALNQIVQAL